ncbi:(2Fe-2S)-binding protein [Chitinimonas arctica]|uniref:(2Fe-2S)-binding protein n=1 Tax=Chitinimonas arctica TaxID=2594795 RepID=A0A516SED1_9NEIS|nr:(2Fe-2S)-binding protein [Chitinimonas arctica]QDQ26527.1 (2Fe-2S)-binding protein [Chitinimonas arctica]
MTLWQRCKRTVLRRREQAPSADSPSLRLIVNGGSCHVRAGSSLAAVLAQHGCRRSVEGQLRAPLCGMGVCYECRVTVDGRPHQRACQILARDGMTVRHES